jgi:hypothetical protein
LFSYLGKELVRELKKDSSTITRVRFTATSSAVIEVNQNGQRLLNNIVRAFALHLTDKANAAGIVLKLWVVETLFLGKSGIIHFWYGQKVR